MTYKSLQINLSQPHTAIRRNSLQIYSAKIVKERLVLILTDWVISSSIVVPKSYLNLIFWHIILLLATSLPP